MKMHIRFEGKFVALLLALVAGAGCGIAQQTEMKQEKPWEKIPVRPLHAFQPQLPKRILLKNGIVVFLQEDHELPFVSGYVLVPGGSRDESAAQAGLVDLYGETWRTSGTAKMDGDALDDLLEAKAASLSTGGGEDSTTLAWESLKGDADQVLGLAMDLLLHPEFRQEKLELAKQQAATGITRRNDQAGEIAGRESEKLVYGANSAYTHQPELGTISKIGVKDLKEWHDRTLQGTLIVGISGDFDPVAMEAKLRSALDGLPRVKVAAARKDTFAGPAKGIYFVDKPDVNQSNIEIVGLGTDRHNPDLATLVVMNEIFGGGFGSRLFQKIRTELGLAYAVSGSYGLTWDHPGIFRVHLMTKSASTVDATKATMAEIDNLLTVPFTQTELDRAKDEILNSFLFRYDTKDKVLNARVLLEYYGYPENYLETYRAGVEKVTVADLERAAKKYIAPGKLAVLVVGNGSEIEPPLDKLNMGAAKAIDITIPQPESMAPSGAKGETK